MKKFILLAVVVMWISHSFVEAQPLNDIPQPRWTHQMTYDEANKQILLFGGASSKKMLGDLWTLMVQNGKNYHIPGHPQETSEYLYLIFSVSV